MKSLWLKSCVQLLYWPSSRTHWWPLNPSLEKHTHLTNTHTNTHWILSVMLIASNQFFCSSFNHKYALFSVYQGLRSRMLMSGHIWSAVISITQTHLHMGVLQQCSTLITWQTQKLISASWLTMNHSSQSCVCVCQSKANNLINTLNIMSFILKWTL